MKVLPCMCILLLKVSVFEVFAVPVVNTTSGLLNGTSTAEAHAFYAVPFAQPPIGSLRFKSPLPVSHQGSLDVSGYKYIQCPQSNGLYYTEDCLVLNVFVPSTLNLDTAITPEDRLPVMVWIYGGAFMFGAIGDPVYDGKALCNRTNTVVVSANYRLGAFGFLSLNEGDVVLEGNQGIRDQQLALTWVKDNIANFGGDKDKVTIFGESAGAQSVVFHLVSPTSESLFHRAIIQSSPAYYQFYTNTEANELTRFLLQTINCTGTQEIQCLLEKDASIILSAYPAVSNFVIQRETSLGGIEPFRPYVDKVLIQDQPLKLIQSGNWNKKAIIVGANTEEGYSQTYQPETHVSREEFVNSTIANFGSQVAPLIVEEYSKQASNEAEFNYAKLTYDSGGDGIFVCPTRAIARLAHKTTDLPASVYFYSNAYPPNASTHAVELAYVFRTLPTPTADDNIIMNMFSDYWGNFAHNGVPQSNTFATWPAYASTADELLRIKVPNTTVLTGHKSEICDFWDSLGIYINLTTDATVEMTTSNDIGIIETTSGATCYKSTNPLLLYMLMLFLTVFTNI
nr:cholinesterase 1-like [Ciona intestinalis]|eukprot:XP_018668662.1 cholinesterase 1-like [Ciona intestinalis]